MAIEFGSIFKAQKFYQSGNLSDTDLMFFEAVQWRPEQHNEFGRLTCDAGWLALPVFGSRKNKHFIPRGMIVEIGDTETISGLLENYDSETQKRTNQHVIAQINTEKDISVLLYPESNGPISLNTPISKLLVTFQDGEVVLEVWNELDVDGEMPANRITLYTLNNEKL